MSTPSSSTNTDKPFIIKNTDGFNDFCQNVIKMLNKSAFTDITFICNDNVKIQAHQFFISAWSEVIQKLIIRENLIKKNYKPLCITMPNINSTSLQEIINVCYFGELKITFENIHDILVASTWLKINFITEKCLYYLESKISAENCLRIIDIGIDVIECQDLMYSKCKRFIELHFDHFAEHDLYLEQNIHGLVGILKNFRLCVPDEQSFFKCLMNWIDYDLTDRVKYCAELLNFINFKQFPEEFLKETVLQKEAVIKSGCNLFIEQGAYNHAENVVYRHSYMRDIPIVCGYLDESASFLTEKMMCSAKPGYMSYCGKLPNKRNSYCVTTLNNYIYILGGKIGDELSDEVTNTVDIYDPCTLSWKIGQPMLMKRFDFNVGILNNKIFVVGGRSSAAAGDNDNNKPVVGEMYDPIIDKWILIPQLEISIHNNRIAFVNENIYIFGYQYCREPSHIVTRTFDIMTNKWSELNDFPDDIIKHITLTDIVLVSGNNVNLIDSNRPEKYYKFDTTTNEWITEVLPMDLINPAEPVDLEDTWEFVNDTNNRMKQVNVAISYNDRIFLLFNKSKVPQLSQSMRAHLNRVTVHTKMPLPC